MNKSKLYNVLVAPLMTEKSLRLTEKNKQFAFKVAKNATKDEIKQAVESLFNVKVNSVNTANIRGKNKTFKQTIGKRSDWKNAYIGLNEGQDIEFAIND